MEFWSERRRKRNIAFWVWILIDVTLTCIVVYVIHALWPDAFPPLAFWKIFLGLQGIWILGAVKSGVIDYLWYYTADRRAMISAAYEGMIRADYPCPNWLESDARTYFENVSKNRSLSMDLRYDAITVVAALTLRQDTSVRSAQLYEWALEAAVKRYYTYKVPSAKVEGEEPVEQDSLTRQQQNEEKAAAEAEWKRLKDLGTFGASKAERQALMKRRLKAWAITIGVLAALILGLRIFAIIHGPIM